MCCCFSPHAQIIVHTKSDRTICLVELTELRLEFEPRDSNFNSVDLTTFLQDLVSIERTHYSHVAIATLVQSASQPVNKSIMHVCGTSRSVLSTYTFIIYAATMLVCSWGTSRQHLTAQ